MTPSPLLAPPSVLAVAEDDLRAGPLGLLVVLLLVVATVLLVRNMSGRLKRLPPSFPDHRDERSTSGSDDPVDDDSAPPRA